MKTLDVLLINLPVSSNWKQKFSESNSLPPLGLLYIASYIKHQAYNVELLDLAVEKLSKEQIIRFLEEKRPSIVGLSTYCEAWKAQQLLTKLIKQVLPGTTLVAGGPFASFCYANILETTDADYIVRGEGEISMLKICDAVINKSDIDLAKTPGIICKANLDDPSLHVTGERIRNLDDLPFPDREIMNKEKYVLPYTILTSRGCPGRCIFCSSKAFWGKRVCIRSADSIIEEIVSLYEKYTADTFHIADDTFTSSYERVIEVCSKIRKTGIAFTWGCESRVDVVNEKLMAALKDAGCKKIQFGFESADNEILRKLKKNVTVEQIENSVMLASKYDLHVQTNFIVGHVFDTKETIEKTINFANYIRDKYNVYVTTSVNTPFPGTEQYIKAKEYGMIIHSDNWNDFMLNNPIISTKNLSLQTIRDYFNKAINMVFKV